MKIDIAEGATAEFKEKLPAGGINKSIIDFVNTHGGDMTQRAQPLLFVHGLRQTAL